jgi:hypothetical protein
MARNLIDGRASFSRYIETRGEIDSEEQHHHDAAVTQIHRQMEHLPLDEQQLLETVFPLDGSAPVDIDDSAAREQLAADFGTTENGVRRMFMDALERMGKNLYEAAPTDSFTRPDQDN